MAKPQEVATELRKWADALDRMDSGIKITPPFLLFSHSAKDSFQAMARTMPRPFQKKNAYPGEKYAEIQLKYVTDAIISQVSVPQALTCELVEPARPAIYRCDPILSPEEDAALETTQS